MATLKRVLITLTEQQLAALDAAGTNRAETIRQLIDDAYGLEPAVVRPGPEPGTYNGGGWARKRELESC